MNTQGKEIAKFACGFETLHTLFHAYLWLSGTTFIFWGFQVTPAWSFAGTIINAVIAIWLGTVAWRTPTRL